MLLTSYCFLHCTVAHSCARFVELLRFDNFNPDKIQEIEKNQFEFFLKSIERSEDSYIVLPDFLIFRGLNSDFFLSSVHFYS